MSIKILLIEDDHDDVAFLKEALDDNRIVYSIEVITDGGLAADYIANCSTYPDIVILDFNLPRIHGRELLMLVKSTPSFNNIPVIILTTSNARADIDFAYKEGADQYLIKPTTIQGINAVISAILTATKKLSH